MNVSEAKRLALLIILDDAMRGLDTSDEWARHPETDAEFTVKECRQVKAQGAAFVRALERRVARLT